MSRFGFSLDKSFLFHFKLLQGNHPDLGLRKYGRAINILKQTKAGLQFDKFSLHDLLSQEEIRNRNVVPISVVGAFRQGKSFFMGYCLRFMYANVSENYFAANNTN